jgi:hypothetical protein
MRNYQFRFGRGSGPSLSEGREFESRHKYLHKKWIIMSHECQKSTWAQRKVRFDINASHIYIPTLIVWRPESISILCPSGIRTYRRVRDNRCATPLFGSVIFKNILSFIFPKLTIITYNAMLNHKQHSNVFINSHHLTSWWGFEPTIFCSSLHMYTVPKNLFGRNQLLSNSSKRATYLESESIKEMTAYLL